MKRAAIYLRVSTQDQSTANQEHELRHAAERAGWQVGKIYKDHGISGAKGVTDGRRSMRCAGTPPSANSTS
jgi:DNA invertase Pin-like site-specific DNA recombinase